MSVDAEPILQPSNTVVRVCLPFHPSETFVDGKWVHGEGGRIDVVNPATEEIIGQELDAVPAQVEQAVTSARAAFDSGGWSGLTLKKRTAVLESLYRAISERTEEFARIQTAQMGAPITLSREMILDDLRVFRAYLDGARSIWTGSLRQDTEGQSLVQRVPVGVVAAITPWNGPLGTIINKVVPALLAGCSVVLKPAPETPLESGLIAEACIKVGVPAGVFNVVTGGTVTGEALVADPRVDKVTFTGSTTAGHRVGELAGKQLKRQSLELGGKSAGIILADADLATVAPKVASANFFNSGQVCIAITRVLVPRTRETELLAALKYEAESQVVGDPLDEATQLGPVVSKRQFDRVTQMIDAGRREGAAVITGGSRPPHLRKGFFVAPTIFSGVTNQMDIAQREIFGPVLTVIPYDSEDEAIAIANDSQYALHGAVFGVDVEHAFEVAQRIQAGSVSINGGGLNPATPYGGVKGSGVGREHGVEGIEEFFEYKSYVIPSALAERLKSGETGLV